MEKRTGRRSYQAAAGAVSAGTSPLRRDKYKLTQQIWRRVYTNNVPIFQEHERFDSLKEEQVMAIGWSRDGAVQEQIDATVESAVQLAKSRIPEGESLTHCQECEEAIPEARRKALPGVRYCVGCQAELEKRQKADALYNRRGSKDSQLK